MTSLLDSVIAGRLIWIRFQQDLYASHFSDLACELELSFPESSFFFRSLECEQVALVTRMVTEALYLS